MFSFGFSATKLKPQLKMAVHRFQISANKKTAILKQQMREIAVILAEDPPREELAQIRAEGLIREDNAVEAYEILQLSCELLAERIKLIGSAKDCPPDLVSSISTIIWAADRVDIPELTTVKKQFRAKFGKKFEEDAINNVGGILNERVVSKLSIEPPAAYLVQVYLERICEQFEVDWKPKNPVAPDKMAEPMEAPVGYSVQYAGASGFGEVAASINTGTMDTDQEIGYYNGGKGDDGSGGGGGVLIPPVVPSTPVAEPVVQPASTTVPATPYVPSDAESPKKDFEEVDIFVPAIPSAPTSTKDDTNPPLPPAEADTNASSNVSSYDDLAARFDKLKK